MTTVECNQPDAANKFNEALANVRLKRCMAVTAFLAGNGEPASEVSLRLASATEAAEERDDYMLIPCRLGNCAVILDMETAGINPIDCPNFEEGAKF